MDKKELTAAERDIRSFIKYLESIEELQMPGSTVYTMIRDASWTILEESERARLARFIAGTLSFKMKLKLVWRILWK